MKLLFFFSGFISLLLVSCNNENPIVDQTANWNKEESIKMNATFLREEESAIDQFLKRRPDWTMIKTGTGLRYFIYKSLPEEEKNQAKIDDIVTVKFSIELLDGTICYASEKDNHETFMVEKSDIESGLHEGIKFLSVSEKAKFILPSHLAHGLIGDMDQIPPLETIIFDIELLKITTPNEK